MKIAIATGNAHKVKELSRLLDIDGIEFISLKDLGFTGDIIEDGTTFAQNAKIKASFICEKYQIPAIADDSGLCVDALGGEPGIYSARYASKDGENSDDKANIDLLLKNLKSIPSGERSARFVCSMAFCAPDGVSLTVDGICEGHITSDIRGEGGFGYDPLFVAEGCEQSFAEISAEEKNAISHRGRAVRKLAEFLQGLE